MLELKNIYMKYSDGESSLVAVNDVNISFSAGKMIFITGPSGAGKTTLMNIIGGLLHPSSGNVLYDGVDLYSLSRDELAEYRNKTIGYVFQMFYLQPDFSVYENVEIPLVISGVDKKTRRKKVVEVLEYLGLKEKIDKRVAILSGGEKQRVCMARAIVNDPKIILADEPTGNLDSLNGTIVLDFLRKQADDGKVVIVITHNIEDAHKYADEIYRIVDGKLEHENM